MKRGDIFFANIEGHGNIQTGIRPVIIVQNDIGNQFSPVTIVCTITGQKKKFLPTHVFIGTSGGLTKPSTILCEQIQTINKADLGNYVGHISDQDTLDRLDKAIRTSLGLKETENNG